MTAAIGAFGPCDGRLGIDCVQGLTTTDDRLGRCIHDRDAISRSSKAYAVTVCQESPGGHRNIRQDSTT